jgi:hypothetical protein
MIVHVVNVVDEKIWSFLETL